MYATIQKWGNSNGLRLPKTMLEAIGMKENDCVELIQSEDFYGKPIEQIGRMENEDVDWGTAEGSEVW